MTTFRFQPRVGEGDSQSAALGVNAAGKFTDKDLNKAVKLAANNNYVLATAGDELEAITQAIMPSTVNNGFSFGTIQHGGRQIAKVDSAPVAVGDIVVAGAQAALGTPQDNVVVREGTPTLFKWRVISLLSGAGAVGSLVCIERV